MDYKATILIGGKLPTNCNADFLYYLEECKADEILLYEDGKMVVLKIESARDPGGVMLLEDFLERAGMAFDAYHHEDEESFEDCSPEHTQNWIRLYRPEYGKSYTANLTWQFGEPTVSTSDIEAILNSAKSTEGAIEQIKATVNFRDANGLPAFETAAGLEELQSLANMISDHAVRAFLQQGKPQRVPLSMDNTQGLLEFAI